MSGTGDPPLSESVELPAEPELVPPPLASRVPDARRIVKACSVALAVWCGISLAGALVLYELGAPTGERAPVAGIFAFLYYAISLFEVPGLVIVPTFVASVVSPDRLQPALTTLGFMIAVAVVNG